MNRGAVIGLFVFILLVLAALFAPLLAPYAPDVQDKTAFLRPPAWQAGGSAQYLLGTDAVGRDMLSRLLYGARFSLLIGAVVVTLALYRRHHARPACRLFPRLGRRGDHARHGL